MKRKRKVCLYFSIFEAVVCSLWLSTLIELFTHWMCALRTLCLNLLMINYFISFSVVLIYCTLTEKPLIQLLRCIDWDSVRLVCGRAVWLGSDIAGGLDPSKNKSANSLDDTLKPTLIHDLTQILFRGISQI